MVQQAEPQSVPATSRKDVARNAMRAVQGLMRQMGRLYREFVTPVPKAIPGGYVMMLVSPLPNKAMEMVGEVRVWIYVPEDRNLSIRVRVEWTRNAFGFWYRNEIVLPNVDDSMFELLRKMKEAMFFVKTTADGTVKVASMNRGGFYKFRKNPTKDRAARVGMILG